MPARLTDDAAATAVSEAVSRLFLDKFGKGPMHIETFVQGDVMTTVMRDVFTTAERSLIDGGRADSVLTTRMLWQNATRDMFKEAVSVAAGRQVLSVVSGFELDQEMSTRRWQLKSSCSPRPRSRQTSAALSSAGRRGDSAWASGARSWCGPAGPPGGSAVAAR